MFRPWWWLAPSDRDDRPLIVGEPGDGRTLVTTRRNSEGEPTEQVWVDDEHANIISNNEWTKLV